MKEIYEIGLAFRGFVLVNYIFKDLSVKIEHQINPDLRGAFVSAINAFIEIAFNKTSLEYLESGNILFIFKIGEVQSEDSNMKEALILYGLVDKKNKKADKIVKRFLEKVEPILQLFIQKFEGSNFSELNQFLPFKEVIWDFITNHSKIIIH